MENVMGERRIQENEPEEEEDTDVFVRKRALKVCGGWIGESEVCIAEFERLKKDNEFLHI